VAKKITQQKLASYLKRKQKLTELQKEIKATEETLLAELNAGVAVQPGLLVARIKEWERRSPSWKTVVERELGEEYAARVLAGTRPDKFTSLVVEIG
jgi:indole-3-glycerol phosphate synthase